MGTLYAPGKGPRFSPGPMIVTAASDLGLGITPVRRKLLATSPAVFPGGGTGVRKLGIRYLVLLCENQEKETHPKSWYGRRRAG